VRSHRKERRASSRLRLIMFVGMAALAAAAPVHSQTQSGQQTGSQGLSGRPAMPGGEQIVMLIRTSLLSLNDAFITGNYTVFRDLLAPTVRDGNTAARISQVYAPFAAKGIDLAGVAILAPNLTEPPAIDQGNRLIVKGVFPGNPSPLIFALTMEPVAGRWRVRDLAIDVGSGNAQNGGAWAPKAPDQNGGAREEHDPKKVKKK
jgi:hypothetical protein